MDLWKNLNKITALFKQSSVKILMLDFDGTLAPIVQSPEEAALSIKTKNLLQELSQKTNLYLAIISGRKLKDIKEKIGLPNIIYGGNHGLEGEIFEKKYSFPITNTTISTLEKIQKRLDKISSQFKGTIVENKKLGLSFHYRLAEREQIPKCILLLNKALKLYVEKKLVSVIAGKKVLEIVPNVNWNKGHFADLVIKQIKGKTRKHPVVIVIGDDKTDEDAFKYLKNDITIVVGKSHQSTAKYYLKNPTEVVKFLQLVSIMS